MGIHAHNNKKQALKNTLISRKNIFNWLENNYGYGPVSIYDLQIIDLINVRSFRYS